MIFLALACFAVLSVGARDLFAGSKAHTHHVSIEGMKFVPETLQVHAGDTVEWTNKDIVPHTVTADDNAFDSVPIFENKSWKHVFLKALRIAYHCKFHPVMKANLQIAK